MLWLLLFALQGTAVEFHLDGPARTVAWPKRGLGFLANTGEGAAFTLKGPGFVLFEVRTAKPRADLHLTLERDKAFVSSNVLATKAIALGPAGFKYATYISFSVAAGEHRYVLTAQDGDVAWRADSQPKLFEPFRAADETPLGKPVDLDERLSRNAAAVEAATSKTVEAATSKTVEAATSKTTEAPPSKPATPAPAEKIDTPRARRVAVYDFESDGLAKNLGPIVTASMLSEIRKLRHVSAIGMTEIREMLSHEANKQMAGCSESDSCLADIAGALGVDDLVTGKMAKLDGAHVLTIRRIDQKHAKVTGAVDQRLKAGSGQEFLAAVGPSVATLFPNYPLREGVTRGVSRELALRLDPPPLPTWAFFTAAGGAVAAAGVGAVFGLLARAALGDYRDYAALGTSQVIDGAVLARKGQLAQSRAVYANALFIGAGAMAVISIVVALFTDWHGYRDAALSTH